MGISEKLITIAENTPKVYNQGYDDGYGVGSLPVYYAGAIATLLGGAILPENTELVLRIKNIPYSQNNICMHCTNLKTIKLIGENEFEGPTENGGAIRECPQLELADFTEWKTTPLNIAYFALNSSKLHTILGNFDLSQCTNTTMAFYGCSALENISFVKETIKISISFSHSLLLSNESIQSIIDGLADLTGGTAQTLTLHTNVGAKLTDEQKATITAKNWTLVY